MSELPHNWKEIKADKAFWVEVKASTPDGILSEEDYDLHDEAVACVIHSSLKFSVNFHETEYASVNEVAGKYYIGNWMDVLMGPYDTVKAAALDILEAGFYGLGPFDAVHSSMPTAELLKLCEPALPIGQQAEINDVKYVRTEAGLIPV
jgi:hypothetical protein